MVLVASNYGGADYRRSFQDQIYKMVEQVPTRKKSV